jgi:uncharacterized protein YjiS (DUF1127 family)
MKQNILQRTGIITLIVNLVVAGFPQSAFAGLIGTGTAIALEQNQQQQADVRAFLDREDVREQLVDLGVSPEDAQARIALLTADELQKLNHQINTLPAGAGVLGVVGAVFIVLIILELVGVIDIFNMM